MAIGGIGQKTVGSDGIWWDRTALSGMVSGKHCPLPCAAGVRGTGVRSTHPADRASRRLTSLPPTYNERTALRSSPFYSRPTRRRSPGALRLLHSAHASRSRRGLADRRRARRARPVTGRQWSCLSRPRRVTPAELPASSRSPFGATAPSGRWPSTASSTARRTPP